MPFYFNCFFKAIFIDSSLVETPSTHLLGKNKKDFCKEKAALPHHFMWKRESQNGSKHGRFCARQLSICDEIFIHCAPKVL